MASFNKAIIIGNLTADPELKQTASGLSVTSITLAVNRRVKAGEEQVCDFIPVVAWRQTAEFICRYFKKGNPLLVCGQIQIRSWTDQQGVKHYATEIIADEAAFVQSATATEPPAEEQGIVGAHRAAAYGEMPAAYQQGMPLPTQAPQFEEIPNDGDLPF